MIFFPLLFGSPSSQKDKTPLNKNVVFGELTVSLPPPGRSSPGWNWGHLISTAQIFPKSSQRRTFFVKLQNFLNKEQLLPFSFEKIDTWLRLKININIKAKRINILFRICSKVFTLKWGKHVFYLRIVNLQCCVSFKWTTKWCSYTYIFFFRFFSILGY